MYLGLDFGTSGARACVIGNDKIIAWQQRISYPAPATQTPAEWRAALHELLGAVPKHIAANLQGIAIDGTSGTVLLCDTALEPCSPALLYNDNRAQLQAEQLKAIAPHGHTVCTATSGLAKFLWLTAPRPSAGRVSGGGVNSVSGWLDSRLPTFGIPFTDAQQGDGHLAAHFLHQADWLTTLLSGQPGISDYHNALKTGYDVERLCWPDWVMALPHSHLLPQVLAPSQVIGQIQPDIAAHFGINPKCTLHAGTTDSTAAFIASGVNETGVGVTTLGTTLVLKQLSAQRIEAPEYGVYSHRYGELWLAGGASNAGAGVLRRYFDDTQLAALSIDIDPSKDSPLGYYPLPGTGERFPVNDALLKPRLEPRPGNDVEFLHGLLQGLAHIETAGYARLAELGAPALRHVVTTGGGAKNVAWRILRERLLGVPVSAAEHSEAAYGSALLCLEEFHLPRSAASN
jgi:D-ribulokinase